MKQLAIFLHSSRFDRVYQAVNLVATAASMGRKCYLFLFFEALASFSDGSWDNTSDLGETNAPGAETLARNFDLAGMPSLYEVLAGARETGALKVCACSTSVRLLELESAEVRTRVDEIVGLAKMLELCDGDTTVLYI